MISVYALGPFCLVCLLAGIYLGLRLGIWGFGGTVAPLYPEPKYQIGQKVIAADQVGEIGQILNPWRAAGRTEYIYLIRFPDDDDDWMWHPYELEEPQIVLADSR